MAVGPGTYKEPPKFGDECKNLTIAGPRRDASDTRIPGPGSYTHEIADAQVKVVNPAWTI